MSTRRKLREEDGSEPQARLHEEPGWVQAYLADWVDGSKCSGWHAWRRMDFYTLSPSPGGPEAFFLREALC